MPEQNQEPSLTAEEQIRLLARDEANTLIIAHLQICPFVSNNVEERMRSTETKLARLFGFMAGSGILGGISGGAISKFIN